MKIIDKEIELETNCSLQVLNELVELYRVAIEYYEEVKSQKFWDFQERLQKILMRPNVLKVMQEENLKYKNANNLNGGRTRRKTETTKSSQPHKALTTPDLGIVLEENSPPQKNIIRILTTQMKRTENVTSRAMTDLKSQEDSLSERLSNRKQKLLNMSTDSCYVSFGPKTNAYSLPQSPLSSDKNSFFFEFESDKSAGANPLELHQTIEKIMEESFSEKSERITEIKVKYNTQIAEMENEGVFYAEIIKEMKKEMQKEIDEVSAVLDGNRKKNIINAKADLGIF